MNEANRPDRAKEEVTCMNCRRTFVPTFAFDFYPIGEDPGKGQCEHCMMKNAFGQPAHNEPVPPPPGHEDAVCKKGKGEAACSFLGVSGGFRCMKGSAFESAIRERRAQGSMIAKGDNCSGPPDFTVR